MENREAIEVFDKWIDCKDAYQADPSCDGRCYSCEYYTSAEEEKEALQTAISALEEQEQDRWIPVTEKLPEEYGEYRITWKTSYNPRKRFIGDAEYEPGFERDDVHDRFKGEWLLEDYIKIYPNVEVIAWKPIGEPYTEEES